MVGVILMATEYSELSRIYDYLVSGVDFESWIDYVEKLLDRFSFTVASVADVACGTGNTTFPFARRGYVTTGVDISGDMLELARAKAIALKEEVTFLQQDMRCLSLPEKVDLVTCFHDGLNYLLHIEDIELAFRRVFDNLRNGGAFIFDINRVNWLSETDGRITMVDEEDMTLIWETGYDNSSNIWRIKLTAFVRDGNTYRKFTEIHHEKGYQQDEIRSALEATGFKLLGVFNAFTFEPADNRSLRHFYVAQKQ